jgi:hypothetical protein
MFEAGTDTVRPIGIRIRLLNSTVQLLYELREACTELEILTSTEISKRPTYLLHFNRFW